MRHSKQDRTKVIVLSIVLVAVWAVIGVRYVVLARHWEAKTAEAHRHEHAAGEAAGPPRGATQERRELPQSPLVASLSLRVPPPERDPFYPVVPPRTGRASAAPVAPKPSEEETAAPLPIWSPGSKNEGLRIAGIVMGNPPVAVLREGDRHHVVQEGDWLDERTRIEAISRSSVTIRERGKTHILRLGR